MDSYLVVQLIASILFTVGIFVNYLLIKRESTRITAAATKAADLITATAADVSRRLEEKAILRSEKLEEKAALVAEELKNDK